jgi:four helix bundle protein
MGWEVCGTDTRGKGTVSRKQGATSSKKPHRNLTAWQKAMDLVVAIYHTTRNFPKEEMYGLTSQLRRAAVSVPSNIAEGAADRTVQQFSNFLSNAIGSLNEIETQLDLAFRLGYLEENDYHHLHEMLDECLALTYGLRKSLRDKGSKQ